MSEFPENRLPKALAGLATTCSCRSTPPEILEFIYREFDEIIPFTRMGYATIEHSQSSPVVVARWQKSPRSTRLKAGFAQPLKGSSLALVAERRIPRVLNDLRAYLKKRPQSDSTRLIVAEGIQSSLTCPILIGDKPVAFLFFSHHFAQAYSDFEVDVAKCLASWMAFAIQAQRTQQAADESTSRLVAAFEEMLGMANPIAADHAARVRARLDEFAGRIDREQLARAYDAATVCNLGYVGISEDTTRKAFTGDQLTAGEKEQIDSQYQVSAHLIRSIPLLHQVGETVSALDDPSAESDFRSAVELVRLSADVEMLMSRGLTVDEALEQLSSTTTSALLGHLKKSNRVSERLPRRASLLSQNLKPGMILDLTLCSRNGKLLLARGVRLTDELIGRIQDYDVKGELSRSRIDVLVSQRPFPNSHRGSAAVPELSLSQ